MTCVPAHAEHFSLCYGHLTFWRRHFTHYNSVNEERLQPMHVLQYWERGKWIDDPTASSRTFQSIDKFINCDCTQE